MTHHDRQLLADLAAAALPGIRGNGMSTTPCTKRRYGSERSAKQKLRELRKSRRRRHAMKVEDHAYHCQHCGAWHLTSQPRDYTLAGRGA